MIGASRKILSVQILSESIFLFLFSFVFALGFIVVLLPQFNELTGKILSLNKGQPGLVR